MGRIRGLVCRALVADRCVPTSCVSGACLLTPRKQLQVHFRRKAQDWGGGTGQPHKCPSWLSPEQQDAGLPRASVCSLLIPVSGATRLHGEEGSTAATGPSCSQSLLNKAGQEPLSWDCRPHPHRVLSTRAPCQGWRSSPPREAVCCLRPLPWAWGTEDIGAHLTMVLSSQGQRGGPGPEGGQSRGLRAGDPGPELWLQRREARCPLRCRADGVRRPCPHMRGKTVRPGAGGHVDLGSAGGGVGGGGGRVPVSVWWARPCPPWARGCCRREGRGPRAACLRGQPRGALACGPPPLVPSETPGSHLAVTGPLAWAPRPPGLPSLRPAWVLPLGWEASAGAGGWPPSVLWKLPVGEACWLLSGWRHSELGHRGPHHSPTAEAAAPDPSPDVACGPGGLGRGPPGHPAQKPCSGLGPGGRVRVSEWGQAVLGAQTLSLSLPGHASGGAAWP